MVSSPRMILCEENASYFPTMLELLHSVWLCSQLTAKPPDVRDFREHRRKTLLLQLPTQHTSTATADNGRQSTYLTGRSTCSCRFHCHLLTLSSGTFPIFTIIYHGYHKIVGNRTFSPVSRNLDIKQHNSYR